MADAQAPLPNDPTGSATAAPPAPAAARLAGLKIQRGGPAAGRRRRRRWPAAVAVIVAAGVFWFLLVPRRAEVQSTPVQTAYGSQQYQQLAASGYVVAQRRAAVASKATGRLVELNVREGSLLKKGDLIARVDASDVLASLGAADAGVRQAEAAQRQAEASFTLAQVQQANAEDDLRRVQGLAGQHFVSTQAVDAALTRARAAQASTAAARAGVETARAAIGQARAQVQVQQVNRESTDIRAPFDGVVLVKNANVGDLITPFSNASGSLAAVVTMADMGTLEVEADVSESSVAKVKAEQPVEITLDAIPDVRFRGSVARIVPTVDRAKATVMTKIRFEQLDPRVLPEMSAKVTFLSQAVTAEQQKPLQAVNPKAIAEREGKPVVFRIGEDGQVEAVPVTPGRQLGELRELGGSGLKTGDKLVLSPPEKLKSGQKVKLVTAAPGAK
ncbi:MAG TPA: efflux RND transporter periplasmic adaptor subunit [Ideonella sp.]|uniref:efflux RND transporter periplasmic adaptor subunit n=1 Tax=Ideonella sp. TaxID=1929293 RepID=UPI002C91A609|nr:efflux RND transporter periplasmic adaptor subunit [Ideonella sp.]HSI47735.1 efflux RND transporter periplasmic adaptor subunit [Ideonella sp.]